jgi:hypothetical protein
MYIEGWINLRAQLWEDHKLFQNEYGISFAVEE